MLCYIWQHLLYIDKAFQYSVVYTPEQLQSRVPVVHVEVVALVE